MTFMQHLHERAWHSGVQCWLDEENELVYFPLWSVTGSLLGYQRYDWASSKKRGNLGRYFTWITPEYRPLAFWGVDALQYDTLLVTEGIFDALRCREAEFPACAVLTATPSREFVRWFKMLTRYKRTVGILDNDENLAGQGLVKLCDECVACEGYKDIGEYPPHEAKTWLGEIV